MKFDPEHCRDERRRGGILAVVREALGIAAAMGRLQPSGCCDSVKADSPAHWHVRAIQQPIGGDGAAVVVTAPPRGSVRTETRHVHHV